jgi:hypothetical protein
MTTKKLLKNIKGVFKLPVKKRYFGKIRYYTPYFEPRGFCNSIIKIRKLVPLSEEKLAENTERGGGWAKAKYSNMPMTRRSKNWIVSIFGSDYYIRVGSPFKIINIQLGWKDKWECYDDKTEILTKEGWKYFKNITYNDRILCLNNKNVAEYHKPLKIIEKSYCGKMYQLKSTGVDLLVTPTHKLYVAKGNLYGRYSNNTLKSDFELCTPDKYFKKSKRFLKSFKWEKEDITEVLISGYTYTKKGNKEGVVNNYKIEDQIFNADWFLKFLGFFTAEGCANEEKGEIFIAACNDGSIKATEEQKSFEEVLTKLGFKIKKTHTDRTAIGYKIYNKALAKWLVKNCGKLAQNKKAPTFIKDISSRQINIYLNWLYKGDGHKYKTSHILCTTSKKLSSDVEELILKSGKTFYTSYKKVGKSVIINERIVTPKHGTYHINWLQDRNDINVGTKTIKESKNYKENWTDYNGKVYCVTVPYNKIFIKRKGKGVWCGNCPRFEWEPSFQFWMFNWQYVITWPAPEVESHIESRSVHADSYWEQILWYLHYSNKDIRVAEETWGWTDGDTKESTWNKNYLIR